MRYLGLGNADCLTDCKECTLIRYKSVSPVFSWEVLQALTHWVRSQQIMPLRRSALPFVQKKNAIRTPLNQIDRTFGCLHGWHGHDRAPAREYTVQNKAITVAHAEGPSMTDDREQRHCAPEPITRASRHAPSARAFCRSVNRDMVHARHVGESSRGRTKRGTKAKHVKPSQHGQTRQILEV